MKTDDPYLGKNLFCLILWWGLAAAIFPGELQSIFKIIFGSLGPMGGFLVAIAAYLLIVGVTLIRNSELYPPRQKEILLTHMEDFGDVAAVCGLLGTVLAMICASSSSIPEMSRFLESLYSTFVGSGLYVLTITFRTIMTRPKIVPIQPEAILGKE